MEKEVKKATQDKKQISSKAKLIIAGVVGVLVVGCLIASQVCCEKSKTEVPVRVTQAQTKKQENAIIVAYIGSEKVPFSELEKIKNSIPQIKDMTMDVNLYNKLLDVYLTERVVSSAVKKSDIQNDPAVKKALEDSRKQILTQAFLAQKLKEKATEENLVAVYNKMMESYVPEEEIHARHILVDTEKQAKDLIVKLKAGAKFEDLANKHSKDNNPNGDNGGDLGYFKKRMMIPEFANAAFAIKVGQISEKPVKTPFGWHVIKVEDRRMAAKPTFNEVSEEVHARFNEEMIPVIVAEEMQKAQVVKLDPFELNKKAQEAAKAAAAAKQGQLRNVPQNAAPAQQPKGK